MEHLKLENKVRITSNEILYIMCQLIVLDYILTYLGINIFRVVSESNPLMVSFMDLPFKSGLLLRWLVAAFPIILLKLIENKYADPRIYRFLLLAILSLQIIPYSIHIIWVYNYISIVFL